MIFDVVIVGAGLVGASLARALGDSGLDCALVEGTSPPEPAPGSWDRRIYTISPASQAFLADIGIWEMLDPQRLQPVRSMRVWGDTASRLEFSAYESGAERLATILESGALQRALWQSLQSQPGLRLYCPGRPVGLESRADCAVLQLADAEPLRARLLVGADGAHSWVRDAAGMPLQTRPATHTAVVANFACEKPHQGVAFQWFRADGVLAWLPLPGERFSMVWSTGEDHARSLMALSSADLCHSVAEAGLNLLGKLEPLSPAATFPISPAWVPRRTRPRIVLIGDAAHTVHPLAGQGVNLGFGDASALARSIRERKAPLSDPGEWLKLREFERQRAGDILAMRFVTEGLQRLFGARSEPLVQARNLGLNLTDRLPVVKNLLARRAMGIS